MRPIKSRPLASASAYYAAEKETQCPGSRLVLARVSQMGLRARYTLLLAQRMAQAQTAVEHVIHKRLAILRKAPSIVAPGEIAS